MPQSPDYSPALINLLASDNSNSEESVQTDFARKVEGMEVGTLDRTLTGGQIPQSEESKNAVITVSLVSNFQQKLPPENFPVIFLDARPQNENLIEADLVHHQASKKSRVGSVAVSDAHPQSELGSQSSLLTNKDPLAHS